MKSIAHAVAAAIFFGGPVVLALILIVLLSGCAQPKQIVWHKEGATEQEFIKDRYECLRDAVMTGGTTYIGFGMTERNADPRMFAHCMIARGYTPTRG